VRIHPRWDQAHQWPDKVFEKSKAYLMDRDPAVLPVADLAALLRLALRIEDRDLLGRYGPVALQRRKEIGAGDADLFFSLAFHFQHHAVRRYAQAEQAFRAALASPDDEALKAKSRVHLAGLLIHCQEDAVGGLALLERADPALLSAEDARMRRIYEADALLVKGNTARARALYEEIGTVVERGDLHYAVRRRIRLEAAGDLLRREEYDAAEKIVRAIEWETPLERLNLETGLIMVGVHVGRQEMPFALAHCHRLLRAAPMDPHRPDVLHCLIDICRALNREREAREAYEELLEDWPYSEAAARVKDAWPSTGR
jgi:predicted negative regulator of RcsB-dependent stress response